jgi:hypothetical protein
VLLLLLAAMSMVSSWLPAGVSVLLLLAHVPLLLLGHVLLLLLLAIDSD